MKKSFHLDETFISTGRNQTATLLFIIMRLIAKYLQLIKTMIMRKVSFLLLLLVVLGTAAVSASPSYGQYGIRGGLNVSSVEGVPGNKYRAGFNGGIFGQFMFTRNWGLETGLYYSMKNFKIKDDAAFSDMHHASRLSYLQIPIQALYKFDVGYGLILYPAVGVYAAYGFSGTHKHFDDAEKFDLGLDAGFNIQYEKVILGIGYERGFLDHCDDLGGHNQNFKVSAAFLF